MSADAWSVCPRCTARHDVGYRANEFREDYEVYGAETGTVTVEYNGECQRCGLKLSFTTEHPIPGWQPVNEPIQGRIQSQWDKVPAGWFVETPKGDWLEVGKTSLNLATGKQMVTLIINGEAHVFPRDPKGEVWIRRGSLAPQDTSDAIFALEEAFTTAILHDEPPGQS